MHDLMITNIDLLENPSNQKAMFPEYPRTFHEFLFQKYTKDIPGIFQGYENVFMKSKSSKNCFVGYPVKFLILAISSYEVFF